MGPPVGSAALKELLDRLLGRRGIRLTSAASQRVAFAREKGGPVAAMAADGGLEVNAEHPMVAAILRAKLSEGQRAAYLATVVFTALNRLARGITDSDDAKFQQALAEDLRSGTGS